MTDNIYLFYIVVYMIIGLVIYHGIFTVWYFNISKACASELVGAFIFALIMTAVSLYYWWITCIIILLVGLGVSAKIGSPGGKGAVMIIAAVFAIYTGVAGYKLKHANDASNSSQQSSIVSNSSSLASRTASESHEAAPVESAESTSAVSEPTSAPEAEIITFGSYEQDGDTSNGKEPIEWLVLEKDGDAALVVSRYGLDCKPYNTKNEDVTWETCSLRKWLNSEFLNEAFSQDEQGKIKTSVVTADANPDYNTSPGNDTNDKVFCLSILEAQKYFSSDESRKCQPTSYAVSRGARKFDNGYCVFWLRSPGYHAHNAAYVDGSGAVNFDGSRVLRDDGAVRPALRISIDSSFASSSGDSASSSVSSSSSQSSASGKVLTAADCRKGSYVTFGSYPQNNGDTPEPIEWLVLEKDGNTALVVSKYGLDCKPYNTKDEDVTWETCSLRKWLNSEFLNEAFSAEEQGKIKSSVVTADRNPESDTPSGNDTNDKVFCLSIPEAQKYFSSDESRKCQATSYAKSRGVWKDGSGYCMFWLRSPGYLASRAAYVYDSGAVNIGGNFVSIDGNAVRPALRIIL